MRVANWQGEKIFSEINDLALDNANGFMDMVAEDARRLCPIDPFTFREGKFSDATVSFTPKTGKNKGKLIQFETARRWLGREPGNLRRTIRRVNKPGSGKIRVYAGNYKIYWAFMVERGTASTGWGKGTKAQPFLRPAFHTLKNEVVPIIKNGRK